MFMQTKVKGEFKALKAINLCKWSLLHAFTSKKSLFVLFVMGMFTYILVSPITNIAEHLGLRLTPLAYPLLVNDKVAHLMLLAGYILLLATIDQNNISQQAVLPRAGYCSAAIGRLLFIAVIALLYQVMITLLSQAWLLNVTDWSLKWGEGWNFLSVPSNTTEFHRVFLPSAFLLSEYTVIEVIWKTYLFEWALLVLLGIVSVSLNKLSGSAAGTFTAMGLSLTDILFYNMFPIPLRILSPVSLSMLSTFQEPERICGITQEYATGFFLVALPILGIAYMYINLLWLKKRKKGCFR